MKDKKIVLEYINLLIDQSTATADAEDLMEALDQIQEVIKFQLHLIELEEEEYV